MRTFIRHLDREAEALGLRLATVRPLGELMPMVASAAPPRAALRALDRHLHSQRRRQAARIQRFRSWLRRPDSMRQPPERLQRQFNTLRLHFNAMLSQVDIFADVLTQRGEHHHGVWLAGLDRVAADALQLPDLPIASPPLVCYLDRGLGAAIRRIRTRLPGGAANPVSIIRIPRERMIHLSVAGSLFHEVGHQGAALLDLVASLGHELERHRRRGRAWELWWRWRSEVLADLWAVAKLGVAATLGMQSVMSLPKPLVFRFSPGDPHPMPWTRVLLNCTLGEALFPDPQWQHLAARWRAAYPPDKVAVRPLLNELTASLKPFTALLLAHRPPRLHGRTLGEIFAVQARQPAVLRAAYRQGQAQAISIPSPGMVLAILGQARADGRLSAEQEIRSLEQLLHH